MNEFQRRIEKIKYEMQGFGLVVILYTMVFMAIMGVLYFVFPAPKHITTTV